MKPLEALNSPNIKFGDNSLDIIRIISAISIVFGHAIIHLGVSVPKWLLYIQHRWIGLFCLFVISGYVIPASLERCTSTKEYFVKRITRIYPALWMAVLVSTITLLVFGMVYEELIFSIRDIAVWLFGQITVFQFYTPGTIELYGVGNPNGALWTISMEIQIYVLIAVFYKWLKNLKLIFWLVLFGCGVACNILYPFTESYLPVVIYKLINVTFVPYLYVYLIGIFVYIHRAKALKILKKLFWFLLGIYIVWSAINGTLFNFSLGHYTNIITGILVCLLTLSGGYYFGKHRLKHDYSYSIYLYHMIVINVLVVLGLTEQNISIAYTYVVTILLSIVSVRWIEPNGARALKKLLNSRVFTKNSNR